MRYGLWGVGRGAWLSFQPFQPFFIFSFYYYIYELSGGLAQLARACDWQSQGQGFDSPNLHPRPPTSSDVADFVGRSPKLSLTDEA